MIDWDDAFANGAYIPGAAQIYDGWVERSERLRMEQPPVELAYGSHPRERMDVFRPSGASHGVVVFVHGGYWHELDKSSWSFLAAGALARGYSVVIPSYPLAPEASLGQISRSVAAAVVRAGRECDGAIYLAGHSAGGHLVARLLCEDALLPAEIVARVVRAVPVSGVFDLRPLLHTQMNDVLKLDAGQARAESPALLKPVGQTLLTLYVGAGERPEFLRQTRLMGEAWSGPAVSEIYEPRQNHFSVLDSMSDPNGALCRAILDR